MKKEKEIYLGNGLYKYVQETFCTLGKTINAAHPTEYDKVEWRIVELENGGFIRRPFKIQTESEIMQDELEPIFHPTQHDESDDIEESKKEEGKLTEFEKSEIERKIKIKKRSVWGNDDWHFFKGEKWEWKNDT